LSYKEEPDTIEFSDELGEHYRYMYTTSSCLNKADTYTIYLPGTPVSELSEEVAEWLKTGAVNDSESELVVIIIADEANGYGIYSTDRPEPLEEAGRCYSGAVSSCDYYTEKISEATTTLEWLELNAICYSIMDDCLNEIWHLIKYNVEEETYKQLLVQQQAWISQKEEEANKAAEEWEGGSFASVAHMEKLFTLTQERCEELLPYLE
ncbi:MAG: lysozyme inhibitor LprI family protein, partial [Lachnospiraceae bacterium]